MPSLQAALGPVLAVRATARVRGGTKTGPFAAPAPAPTPGSGAVARLRAARADQRRPVLPLHHQRRLRELLGGQTGQIRPQLRALYQALAAADRPEP